MSTSEIEHVGEFECTNRVFGGLALGTSDSGIEFLGTDQRQWDQDSDLYLSLGLVLVLLFLAGGSNILHGTDGVRDREQRQLGSEWVADETNGTKVTEGSSGGQSSNKVECEGLLDEDREFFPHNTAFKWDALEFLAFGVNCCHT